MPQVSVLLVVGSLRSSVIVGQSVLVGAERSDTLVRYRQRTLSKASGPPACAVMCVLRLANGVTGACVVSAGSQNGCGIENYGGMVKKCML